jgi:hypothetical protein
MNKKTAILLAAIFITGAVALKTNALAQESGSDAEKAAEKVNEESVKKSLKDKLEEVANEKIEKAKDVLGEKSSAYAYVGTISETAENTLTVETKKGEKKIEIAEEAEIVFFKKGVGEEKIEIEDIEKDSYAIAMGTTMKEDGTLIAERIMLSAKPESAPERKVIFGKIEEVDEKEIKIKNKEEYTLSIPKNLNLEIAGAEKPTLSDVEIEDKVIFVIVKDEDEEILKAMFVVPGKNSAESEENQLDATESAKVASPSAEEKEEE